MFIFGVNSYVLHKSDWYIVSKIEDLEPMRVWLILWAWVNASGYPSAILRDRLEAWLKAYELWKIQRIIVSGDNSSKFYDEPTNMKKFLVDLWVSAEHIYPDYAGFDTYDSLYRAQYIFGVNQLVIFTQEYHLKRAIYIARGLGMVVQWYISDRQEYRYIDVFERREVLSRLKAFFEVEIFNSKPKFLWEKIELK